MQYFFQSKSDCIFNFSFFFSRISFVLLLAKINLLTYLQNYLSQKQQRVKVGSFLSEWLAVVLGVPQRSILGPVLFNSFFNALLLFIKKQISATLWTMQLYMLVEKIQIPSPISQNQRQTQFKDNEMVTNPSKFQLLFLSKYKNIETNLSLMKKPLYHQIQLDYFELPQTKILILNGMY